MIRSDIIPPILKEMMNYDFSHYESIESIKKLCLFRLNMYWLKQILFNIQFPIHKIGRSSRWVREDGGKREDLAQQISIMYV